MAVQGIRLYEDGFIPPVSLNAPYFTDVKIQRIALYTFAAIAAVGAGALIGFSVAGTIAWPFALIAIPLITAKAGLISWGRSLKDYDNPTEIAAMRMGARYRSFSAVVEEHGLERVQRYQIVSPLELGEKFRAEYAPQLFSSMIKRYPFAMIIQNGWMLKEELRGQFVRELHVIDAAQFASLFSSHTLSLVLNSDELRQLLPIKTEVEEAILMLQGELEGLNQKYPNRQECLLRELDGRRQEALRRADEMKQQLLHARSAEEHADFFIRKPGPDYLREQLATNAVRYLTDDQVRARVDAAYRAEIQEINTDRQRIMSGGRGLEDQRAYDAEKGEIMGLHQEKMGALNERFIQVRSTL